MPTRRTAIPTILLAAACLATVPAFLSLERGRTFFYDEWAFVVTRSPGGPLHGLDIWFQGHNEHLMALPAVFYRIGLGLFGLDNLLPYQLTDALLHVTSAILIFVMAARRVGAWPALALALPFLWLGAGWENMLWGFNISWAGAVTFGLAALLAIERRTVRGDVAACLLLLASVLCCSVFIPFMVALTVEVVIRRAWRRLWVTAVPGALYGLWLLLPFGRGGPPPKGGLADVVPWALDAAAASVGGVMGEGGKIEYGRPLLVLLVVGLVLHFRRPQPDSARLLALLAGVSAFFLAVGHSRAGIIDPFQSRYVYVGAAFVLLILAELFREHLFSVRETVIVLLLAAVAVGNGADDLRRGKYFFLGYSKPVSAELTVVELLGPKLPPDLVVDELRAPQLKVGEYLDVADRLSSSAAYSLHRLEHAPTSAQNEADKLILRSGLLSLTSPAGDAATSSCRLTDVGSTEFRVKPGGRLRVDAMDAESPTNVYVRRFSENFQEPLVGTVPPHETRDLSTPRDRSHQPYVARIDSPTPVRVCGR